MELVETSRWRVKFIIAEVGRPKPKPPVQYSSITCTVHVNLHKQNPETRKINVNVYMWCDFNFILLMQSSQYILTGSRLEPGILSLLDTLRHLIIRSQFNLGDYSSGRSESILKSYVSCRIMPVDRSQSWQAMSAYAADYACCV